ncbi:MAG: hypothetical protein WAM94_19305 [Chromatiaceae bacterium]
MAAMAAIPEGSVSRQPTERFPAIARVRFELEATEPVRLPHYPGSA